MMALFNKAQPRNNGDPAPTTPQLVRSRFQEILDSVAVIVKESDRAASLASALVHDLEKGLRYFDRLKVDLTQCLTEAGVEPNQTSIEEEIKAFIPKSYRDKGPDNEPAESA
jgi:hypothetical protein